MENKNQDTTWGIKTIGKRLFIDTTNGESADNNVIPYSYMNLALLENDKQFGKLAIARFDGRSEITYFGDDQKLEKVIFRSDKQPIYQEGQFYKSEGNDKDFELKKTKESPEILKTLEPFFGQLEKMINENIEFTTITREESIPKKGYSHSVNGDKEENAITNIIGYTPEGNMYSMGRLHTEFSKEKNEILGISSTRFLGAVLPAAKLINEMGNPITQAYTGQKNGQEVFLHRTFSQPKELEGLEHAVRANIARAMEAYSQRHNRNEFGGFNEQDMQLLH